MNCVILTIIICSYFIVVCKTQCKISLLIFIFIPHRQNLDSIVKVLPHSSPRMIVSQLSGYLLVSCLVHVRSVDHVFCSFVQFEVENDALSV